MGSGETIMKWLLLVLMSLPVLAQPTDTEKILEKFLEHRKKMMEEVMKAFEGDDMIMDDFFKDEGFRGIGQDFTIEENTTADGNMAIYITPKNKNVNLDIKTQDNRIVIKSETKVKQEDQDQQGSSTMLSSSSYTKSIGIPFGHKALDPVAEGSSIKIVLVPVKRKENGRVPINKPAGGETL